jgi:sugar lactone lactonase YvrE
MKSERTTYRGLLAACAVALALLLRGCIPTPANPPTVLFVANADLDGVLGYRNPGSVDGDVPPDANLVGIKTQLAVPLDVAVNSAGQLLVCNSGSSAITVYADAVNVTGNQPPIRNVSGAQTMINNPQSIAVDPSRDLGYVLNYNSTTILVFSGTSTAAFNGNVAPIRLITSASLNSAQNIRLDGADNLYVANIGGNNVLVFPGASALNGPATPRILTSPQFRLPFGVFVDPNDNLFVLNHNAGIPLVLTFKNGSALNGPVTYDTSLTVQGGKPAGGIAVDSNGTGYIASYAGNAIYVYDNIGTRNGEVVPDRTIQGPRTGLAHPSGLWLLQE